MNYLLQASPNAGVMQLVLIGLIIAIVFVFSVFVFRQFNKSKKENKTSTPSSANSSFEIQSESINNNIKLSGYELIDGGKKLVTSFLIIVCTILGNWIYLQFIYENVESSFNSNYGIDQLSYNLNQSTSNLKGLFRIDCILLLISMIYLYLGYYSIRKAGEKLINV